jgi:predicted nucleic acid-binding protein
MAKHEKKLRNEKIVVLISAEEKAELEKAFIKYAFENNLGIFSMSSMFLHVVREWKKQHVKDDQLDLFNTNNGNNAVNM